VTPEPLLQLIRRFEGCRLKAYQCPAGVWTIGWGSTGPDVKAGVLWTLEQAEARLRCDAAKCVRAAVKISPVLADRPLQLAAVADFIYNLGAGRYRNSRLRKRVDAEDWPGAVVEINRWVMGGGKKLPGLVKRRAAEARLLMGA